MEEKVKEIVSKYLHVAAFEIHFTSVIDRSAVASSIILHRMYAALASAGFPVTNYWDIKTFGMLMSRLGAADNVNVVPGNTPMLVNNSPAPIADGSAQAGIDIEEIALLPRVTDFREDEFYKSNFSATEIAYCILQPDPYASFAGLFAAKEAIVKADNSYINQPFHTIVIDHLPGGKPVFPGFSISISHTSSLAIGVAVKLPTALTANTAALSPLPKSGSLLPLYLLTVFSFLLSLFLLFVIYRK